ncbi:carbamate kinase [Vagococcus fluvialis]|uniref:carbamate kinase n=1 Tax=Vagococcus fluvialis TaxID=2738 RepID=UPI001A90AE13|nr:carbamate kinase [Vagococcus fluvialis]MBO0487159.1 carbamate kinase [Vagococcus fluvialis]MCM2138697.1 carbamate kinase [Vagococcus fluvialis]
MDKINRVVIALGGNAILKPGQKGTFDEQKENIEISVDSIGAMIEEGFKLAIVHGNGPQVGQLLQRNELCKDSVPAQPFASVSAQSQGYIGHMIQESIKNRFPEKEVVTILSMTEVDEKDPAFSNLMKPIGLFYTKEEAEEFEEQGIVMGEDSGRGYRRLVPSPKPKEIVERKTIAKLLEMDTIVITSGGGGVPVIKRDGLYVGQDAVIDKDLAALSLASDINADVLIILTDVDNVYINYGKNNQEKLEHITVAQLEKYYEEGQFAEGSMGPKVKACIDFAKEGKTAIISSLENGLLALKGEKGTIVTK